MGLGDGEFGVLGELGLSLGLFVLGLFGLFELLLGLFAFGLFGLFVLLLGLFAFGLFGLFGLLGELLGLFWLPPLLLGLFWSFGVLALGLLPCCEACGRENALRSEAPVFVCAATNTPIATNATDHPIF